MDLRFVVQLFSLEKVYVSSLPAYRQLLQRLVHFWDAQPTGFGKNSDGVNIWCYVLKYRLDLDATVDVVQPITVSWSFVVEITVRGIGPSPQGIHLRTLLVMTGRTVSFSQTVSKWLSLFFRQSLLGCLPVLWSI